jgi:hypothetical protein
MRRGYHPHALGGGLLLGLLVAQRPWLVFAAGVAVGIALVFALRALRGVLRTMNHVSRFIERRSSAAPSVSGSAPPVAGPLTVLTDEELEAERLVGLRQGTAAGVRAAARQEVRERAKREAMSNALEEHWQEERSRSVRRAVES